MGPFREGDYAKAIIVMGVACILATGTLGAPRPGVGPQVTTLMTRPAEPAAGDLELILERLKAPLTTPPNDSRPGRRPNYSRTEEWLSSLAADGHWPDLEYEGDRPGWNAHLGRLVQMASDYAIPSAPDYHSAKMLEGVERGLEYWCKYRQPLPHQWWQNTIGQPLELSRLLPSLEDVLPPDLLRQGLSFFAFPSEIDPRYDTGQNMVWFAQQQVISGALARSPEDVAAGSEALQREIAITTGEGIQPDFSFHQHGPQLYNGGYGHDFMVDTAKFATVLAGTRYAFSPEKLSLLADLMLMGNAHMLRGKWLDYSAQGRTLLRRGASEAAVEFAEACGQLAALVPERAAELTALKKHIEGTGAPYSSLGNRYFWNSDFMTHQREAYYISVKMVSNRTVGTETLGGENLKGSWLPFGTTWIVRRGDEYKDIFPVLDWGRLPGVTSAHMATATMNPPDWGRDVTLLHKPTATAPGSIEPESFVTFRGYNQPESFVGGVSDGNYGAAAMVFDKLSTQGHKAWFFFDREMVALGAGISSARDEPVATTLNQTLLHGPVLMDGQTVEPGEMKVPQASWVLHDEVGYAFLAPAAVNIKVGPQTGDWKSASSGYSDAPVTEQVFALWLDHGVRPSGAQYAYAVLPGIGAPQLEAWAAHPPVRIIANTPAQQAVIQEQLGVAEIVFYAPGSVDLGQGWTAKVDHPCLALLAKRANATRISVSSPGGEVPTVHLTLTTPQGEQSLTFKLPGRELAGKSQTMEVRVPLAELIPQSARPSGK